MLGNGRAEAKVVLTISFLILSAATTNLSAQTISGFTIQDQSTSDFNENNGTRFADWGGHLKGGFIALPHTPIAAQAHFNSVLSLDVEGWAGSASTTAATSRFTATITVTDESHCGWTLRFVGRRKGEIWIQRDIGSSHAELHALVVGWSGGSPSGTLNMPELDSGSHGSRHNDYLQEFTQSSTAALSGSGTQTVTLTFAWDTYASCDPGPHILADAPPILVNLGQNDDNDLGYNLDVTIQTCTALRGGPSPLTSSLPPFVALNANGSCCFDAIVRDSTGAGIPNAPVVVSFSACDVTFCADQNSGVTVDPVAKTATAVTDSSGLVHFCVCGTFMSGCVASLLSDGVLLGSSPLAPCPQIPGLMDGYAVAADKYRIVFDVAVTPASATNPFNYALASFGQVTSAVMDGPSAVVLSVVGTGLSPGQSETVTVNGVVSSPDGVAMTTPRSVTFLAGVLTIAEVGAPDPDSLAAVPCADRSRFAGPGSAPGPRLTTYGIATTSECLQDEAGGPRSGIQLLFNETPLVAGHRYLVAGAVDTRTGKTGLWHPVYLRDDGVGTMPSPLKWPLSTILDATCDASQSRMTSDDLLGGLVIADSVVVTAYGSPGDDFLVTDPNSAYADTVRIENDISGAQYAPVAGQLLRVTGALAYLNRFEIQPRDSADIVVLGTIAGIEAKAWGAGLTLSVRPNPSVVGFALDSVVPRSALMKLVVYDVQGRPVKTLVNAKVPAGSRTIRWDGTGASGSRVASGIYFVRLIANGETRTARLVVLR